MHFKDGFKDQNSERYMLDTRIRKLLGILQGEYYYTEHFHPGLFTIIDGDWTYEEMQQKNGQSFDGRKDRWGGPNRSVWFVQRFSIPESMRDKMVIYDCNVSGQSGWYWGAPQALILVNGQVVSGMDVNHRFIELTDCADPTQEYEIAIHAFTDRFFYNGQIEMDMALRAVNPYVKKLFYDVRVPFDVACYLPVDDIRRIDILEQLNTALSMVDFRLSPGEAMDETLKRALTWKRSSMGSIVDRRIARLPVWDIPTLIRPGCGLWTIPVKR